MNEIIKLNNRIKYDKENCNQCGKCIDICKTKALSLIDEYIKLNNEKCISCKKCIIQCETKSLYYNIEVDAVNSENKIAILPYDSNKSFLSTKYKEVYTYELAEKLYVVETAFKMEKITSLKIQGNNTSHLIISDIDNIDLLFNNIYPQHKQYLNSMYNKYYLAVYLNEILFNNNKSDIVLYGVPFEAKHYFENNHLINQISDLPFKENSKYNILDILNTYLKLCKFNSSINIESIDLNNVKTIEVYNKYIKMKILILKDIEQITGINLSIYDFIFICKNDKYSINENLLNDSELNNIYKNKLKAPGNINIL